MESAAITTISDKETALSLISQTIDKLLIAQQVDPVDQYFKENKITRPNNIPIIKTDLVSDDDLDRANLIGESASILPQGEIRDQILFLVLTINNLIFEKSALSQEAEQWKSRADYLLCELLNHTVIQKKKW